MKLKASEYREFVKDNQFVSKLPKELKSSLPSIEEIEAEIGGGDYD